MRKQGAPESPEALAGRGKTKREELALIGRLRETTLDTLAIGHSRYATCRAIIKNENENGE